MSLNKGVMSAQNPYHLLGLTSSASAAEIKSAYRKLAKKHHPDLNPGDKTNEKKFKEITAAYELLSDPKKRARFDSGAIDADGNEKRYYGGQDPWHGRPKTATTAALRRAFRFQWSRS
jgi:DnaJ-class molecular chaperone